jgi:serine/threonine protein kinase
MTDVFIGNYKIIKKIGAGGQAKVYLAVHKDVPNLRVILKILSDPTLADRFKQEADKLALLDGHPSICRIKHFFNEGDDLVIAMEHIEGETLDQLIVNAGKIPSTEALILMKKVLNVLEFAHEREIFHRDIKPSNVMVARSGDIKVIDFGIAKSKGDPSLTMAGSACGTPAYMAPEQFTPSEDTDYQLVDIYAVGVTLFYMLTGRLPFMADNEFVMRDKKLFSDPPRPRELNPSLSADIEQLVLKALQKEPEQRFQTVKEMRLAVEQLIDKRPQKAVEELATQSISTGDAPKRRGGGKGLKNAVMGLVAVAALVTAGYVFWPSGDSNTDVPQPPLLSAPDEGAMFSLTRTPTVSWRAQTPGPLVLEYADNPEFSNGHTIASPGDTAYTFVSELANGTYFWRVWLSGPQGPIGHSTSRSFVVNVAGSETPSPASGLLTFDIEPSADRVTIDDTLEYRNQRSVSLALGEGDHIIELTNQQSNQKRLVDTVTIRADQTTTRNYRFTIPAPPSKLAELRVGSNPKGATVVINGETQPYKTNFAFKLPAGRHIVTALLDLNGTEVSKTDTVVVSAGSTERLYFEFE